MDLKVDLPPHVQVQEVHVDEGYIGPALKGAVASASIKAFLSG
jgi:hypothetical protein